MIEREKRMVRGKVVTVIVSPITLEEARLEFPYRPISEGIESRYCGTRIYDDKCF